MAIPKADVIREFQAPSADKLLGRCEKRWTILQQAGIRDLKLDQRSLQVPIMGEDEEMVKEAISILEEKDLGYGYEFSFLTDKERTELQEKDNKKSKGCCKNEADDDDWNGWITGWLTFTW